MLLQAASAQIARVEMMSRSRMFSQANVQRDATHHEWRAPEHRIGWHVHKNFQLRSGGGLAILLSRFAGDASDNI